MPGGPSLPRSMAGGLILVLLLLGAAQGAFTVTVTEARLLSGGLTGCTGADGISSADCRRGMAEAGYRRRNSEPASVFLPRADWKDAFVQMHSDQWAVNGPVLQRFTAQGFLATQSLLTSTEQWPKAWESPVSFLFSNAEIATSNQWFSATLPFYAVSSAEFVLLFVSSAVQPGVLPAVEATVALGKLLKAAHPSYQAAVMLAGSATNVTAFVVKLHAAGFMPAAVLSVDQVIGPTRVGATAIAGQKNDGKNLFAFEVSVAAKNASGAPIEFAVALRKHSLELTTLEKADPTYIADQTYMTGLAAAAAANNPVIGQSTVAMPVARAEFRHCLAGECELGSLWTKAIRETLALDVAFIPSGGIRGPGWAAGGVKISNIYESDPFANTICRGSLRGSRLFQVFNRSITAATFHATKTEMGDRLLQLSGVRLTYNLQLPAVQRLVMAEIQAVDGSWQPLDRLRLYMWGSVSYLCTAFDQFPELLEPALPGEDKTVASDQTVQQLVTGYITSKGRVTPQLYGVLRNDTSAAAIPSWLQSASTCTVTQRFDAKLVSCFECPAAHQRDHTGNGCVPVAKSNTPVLIGAICASFVVLLTAISVGGLLLMRRRGVRDVRNAPRENPVTLLFTDIQSSTLLWTHAPQSMSDALETHHRVIRECIASHSAYEVKTAGDAFMIAARTAESAVRLASDIQMQLLAAQWPAAIDQIYLAAASDLEPVVDDDPDSIIAGGNHGWCGLRVRIGMQTGEAEVQFDEITKGYDYYGPPVNAAARVESVTRGGEVCGTRTLVDALPAEYCATLAIQSRGEFDLKGIAEPLEVIQILPTALADRKFMENRKKQSDDEDRGLEESCLTQGAPRSATGTTCSSDGDEQQAKGLFVQACFRAVRSKQRKDMFAALAKAWRLPAGISDEKIAAVIGKRAAKAAAVRIEFTDGAMEVITNKSRSRRTSKALTASMRLGTSARKILEDGAMARSGMSHPRSDTPVDLPVLE